MIKSSAIKNAKNYSLSESFGNYETDRIDVRVIPQISTKNYGFIYWETNNKIHIYMHITNHTYQIKKSIYLYICLLFLMIFHLYINNK